MYGQYELDIKPWIVLDIKQYLVLTEKRFGRHRCDNVYDQQMLTLLKVNSSFFATVKFTVFYDSTLPPEDVVIEDDEYKTT